MDKWKTTLDEALEKYKECVKYANEARKQAMIAESQAEVWKIDS
jgi:hypothetical protein